MAAQQKTLITWLSAATAHSGGSSSQSQADLEAMDLSTPSLTSESLPQSEDERPVDDHDHPDDRSDVDSETSELTAPPQKVSKVISHKCRSKCGFKKEFVTKHPWLVQDSTSDGGFCKFCKQYYTDSRGLLRGSDGTFISKPFTKWSKATGSTAKNNKLLKHQLSVAHRQAVSQAEMASQVEKRGSVVSQLQSSLEGEKSENLTALCKYIKIAYWLIKNEIAHTTHYESLIDLCTELDESGTLANWQKQRPDNASYRSIATCTEMVQTIGGYIDEKTVNELISSDFLALMADEATDLRNRTELPVCLRYLTSSGCAIECFVDLQPVSDTTAATVTSSIITILENRSIDCSKIVWVAFDGASNMSGHISGVQTRLREQKCEESTYVHCRSHLLQLACVYASEKLRPLKQLFSSLNSLWRLFSLSPKCTHTLREVQDALQELNLSLVKAGDTKWTSHYRAVKAVVKCLKGILITLQHLHQDSGDLSSEASGLLLIFQDRKSIVLLFAIKDILDPVCRLALQLQHYNLSLCDIPDYLQTVESRLDEISAQKEYLTNASKFIAECEMPILDGSKSPDQEIHRCIVKPYIKVLSETIKTRSNDTVTKMCHATSIFDSKKLNSRTDYDVNELSELSSLHSSLSTRDLLDQWKTFRNYLKVQATKDESPGTKTILQKLASQGGDLADTFPQLSLLSKIILVCPLGTASVERSFSTMGQICNRLRQRILPENLAHCMRTSIEGPATLTVEQSSDIVKKWYSMRSIRRIQI